MTPLSRRELLRWAASGPIVALASSKLTHAQPTSASFGLTSFATASSRVVASDGTIAPSTVRLTRTWDGTRCRSQLVNGGTVAIGIKEVVLFDVRHAMAPETSVYGEG